MKNISSQDLAIVDIGVVKAGQEIEVPTGFSNANFIEVSVESGNSEETKQVSKKISHK